MGLYGVQYATGRDTLQSRSSIRRVIMADPDFVRGRAMANLVACGVWSIIQLVILFGAIQMARMKTYGLAMTANIMAVIPCFSPCCIIGIPFGVWGLIVLCNGQVQSTFR